MITLQRKELRYYPTRLAINLACGVREQTDDSSQGYLVVETNYRVYAYTGTFSNLVLQKKYKVSSNTGIYIHRKIIPVQR